MNTTAPLSTALSILLFIGAWIGFCFLLSYIGGWSLLAQHYRFHEKFHGYIWSSQSGRIGLLRLNGCLNIGANEGGLYLSMLFLFRAGSPPLFIPWKDISVSADRGVTFRYMVLRFSRVPSIELRIRERTGGKNRAKNHGIFTCAAQKRCLTLCVQRSAASEFLMVP
jgi:hypothetical protein